MEKKISVFQLREELKDYHHFGLRNPSPASPVGFYGCFEQASIDINDAYIGLRGRGGDAWIRNIQTSEGVLKDAHHGVYDYMIPCLDYSGGSPSKVQICLTCSVS